MAQVIPAILPKTYDELAEKAGRVRGLAPVVQLDICDGVFVPSRTWPYSGAGLAADPHFAALTKQEEGLPFWEDLDYELDLMIAEPEIHLDEWVPLGASRIVFHIEAIADMEKFLAHDLFTPSSEEEVEESSLPLRPSDDGAKVECRAALPAQLRRVPRAHSMSRRLAAGPFTPGAREIGGENVIEIGLAINPDTPLEALDPYLDRIDFVQHMGIARIGFQRQPFDERTLERVNRLRVAHPDLIITIDGGVNAETAPLLASAGADRLVAGSAIFDANNISAAIEQLQSDTRHQNPIE